MTHKPFCPFGRLAAVALALACSVATASAADAPATRPAGSPWGVAGSSSSYRDHAEWMPTMAAAGVSTVRLFPEWCQLEPAKGEFKWEAVDVLLKNAAANKLEVNGILMGAPRWTNNKSHAFPMDHLDDWSAYVSAAVGHCGDRVRHWEVWNEGNAGFNDGKHTTADYARLAAATYAAAKKANPNVQVGLSVASYDPAYLRQAIVAQAKAGTPNHFDFLAVHPYEIADGLADPDGEIPFLWMTRQLRGVLAAAAPERADAPIWITEIGRKVERKKDHAVTEDAAARDLVKLYTMAAAQGIARTQWFEARDPVGEEAGFGLLARDGKPRPAYAALKALAAHLGTAPVCQGWVALGADGRGYGFVFTGPAGDVLVAWMHAGPTDRAVSFGDDVKVVDPLTATAMPLKAGRQLQLSEEPLIIVGVPAATTAAARANAAKPFPWGGDHSAAKSVACTPGAPAATDGVFQVNRRSTPLVTFHDGSTGVVVRGDQGTNYFVHPSFADLSAREFYVRVTVRRLASGNLGMNLWYEVADSQGRWPYKNVGTWYSVPAGDGWHTHTWKVADACLAKMWGYDIGIRPEQSVPFVIGKVEVSREAFK
ncbi:MAG TPA: hypothetical protein VF796_09275 [Humisphaera sp.]